MLYNENAVLLSLQLMQAMHARPPDVRTQKRP
jgi:hypothetical protein